MCRLIHSVLGPRLLGGTVAAALSTFAILAGTSAAHAAPSAVDEYQFSPTGLPRSSGATSQQGDPLEMEDSSLRPGVVGEQDSSQSPLDAAGSTLSDLPALLIAIIGILLAIPVGRAVSGLQRRPRAG